MAWTIERKENYVFIQRSTDGYLHDYHAKDLTIRKKYANINEYTFYYNQEGKSILFLDKVPFADIIDGTTGLPFATPSAFELWYTLNTGQFGSDGGAVATTEYDLVCDEWLPICKNGIQYFRQYQHIVNNTDGSKTTNEVWKDKNDAVIPALAPPYEIGYCNENVKSIQLFEKLYTPAMALENGNFSNPSTTSQPYWSQISGNEPWTFLNGVAKVETLQSSPNYPTLAHTPYYVNPSKTYKLTFEARGIDNPIPIGSINSVLLVGIDGNGPYYELKDDVWRKYSVPFSTPNLAVSIGFSRDLTSQGLEIRNVQVTQDGDYTCKPFIRHFEGTDVNDTLLDFVTPYTVTDENMVSSSCSDCSCETTPIDYTQQLDTLIENTTTITQAVQDNTSVLEAVKLEQETTNQILSSKTENTLGDRIELFMLEPDRVKTIEDFKEVQLDFRGKCQVTVDSVSLSYNVGDSLKLKSDTLFKSVIVLTQLDNHTKVIIIK